MASLAWLPLIFMGTFGGFPTPPAHGSAHAIVLGAAVAHAASPPAPFVVALDAGHGGSNLGTANADRSLLEKRLTLVLARKLRVELEKRTGIKVVLCRDDDSFMPIRARVRCARQASAQLFLSLHANAVPAGRSPGSQRGFELYVLPPADIEDEAMAAALGQEDEADGAWAAHQVHGAAAASIKAARKLQARLGEALGAPANRGIRQTGASLDVLRGVNAPAVLVEVGYLDHPDDAALLASPDGQDRLVAALARAVVDFKAQRTAAPQKP